MTIETNVHRESRLAKLKALQDKGYNPYPYRFRPDAFAADLQEKYKELETLECYLEDTKTSPEDYDMIITGDLGEVGSKSLYDLLERDGINIRKQHNDCGLMIFERSNQDVHAGGSGCGCAASVLCSKIMDDFQNGLVQNILFMATGALMSPTSSGQGANIPSIAHLVNLKIK